jgi:hypothetical protein
MIKKDGFLKNRVKNLHESTIKMLLFASAMDNETVPTDLTESCKCFINSKTAALAKQELNLQFENRRMPKVTFSSAYTSNMYHGIFLWSSADTPSNHSPFSLFKAEPIPVEEHQSRHLLLQLIFTQGQGMTVDEIKASSKQTVNTPMTFHDMVEQIKMFTIANDIYLGELSVGSQSLCSLQTMINRNRSSFKACERLDVEFTSKFLFAVDCHFQIWLKKCRIAQNRCKVDNSIINFSHLVSQVLFGSFHITLPRTFKMKSPSEGSATPTGKKKANSNNSRGDDKGKHKKKKANEAHDMIKNKAPHPELCMLAGETWAINFANKNINTRPKRNKKTNMCPLWFLQKYCFNNSKHKESHIKADGIPAEQVTSMKNWIKLCRSNAN